jgi:hypothetical protein
VLQYSRSRPRTASISAGLARAMEKYFGREHLTPPVSAEIHFTNTFLGVP